METTTVTDRAESRRRTRRIRFTGGLVIYLGVLAVIFAGALVLLWVTMSNFQEKAELENARECQQLRQQTLLAQAPQRLFEAFLETADADYWTEQYFAAHPDSLDDRGAAGAFIAGLFAPETLQCFKSRDWSTDAPLYTLMNGEKKLASVALTGSELEWQVDNVELLFAGEQAASVTAPAGCTVLCNGAALDESFVTAREPLYSFEDYGDDLTGPVESVTYSVEGLLTEPELQVLPPEGSELTGSEEDGFLLALPEEESGSFRADAEEFVRALVKYYMRGKSNTGGNMNAALAHTVKGSQAYQVVSKAYDGITWAPIYTITIDSLECGQVMIWADNCRSVDVECHATGTVGDSTTSVDSIYRVYFFDMGDGFGIYGLEQMQIS